MAAIVLRAAPAPADPTTGTDTIGAPLRLPPTEFLEASYLLNALPSVEPNPTGFGPEGKRSANALWLIFEASPTLHLFLWNRLDDLTRGGAPGWAFVPSLTMATRFRFLRTASVPVRTPSYLLRANLQVFFARFPFKEDHERITKFRETAVMFQAGHHSNGQEYCPFTAGHVDRECPEWEGDRPDPSGANLVNGDFGTNYVVGSMHRRWVTAIDGNGYARESWATGGALELNFGGFGGLKGPTAEFYGAHRLRMTAERLELTDRIGGREIPVSCGHLRISGGVELIGGTGRGIAPYRVWAEVSRNVLRWGGSGLFARFFSGQDYYNINYVNRIDYQIQAGLIIDLSPPLFFSDRWR
jgi:hypothetical protein